MSRRTSSLSLPEAFCFALPSFTVITQSWRCGHFCIGLTDHFQCTKLSTVVFFLFWFWIFVYYGKTRVGVEDNILTTVTGGFLFVMGVGL